MTLPELTHALDDRGISLAICLVVDAPVGALIPEIRDAQATHKPLLMQRVVREMEWAELRTWRWGGASVEDPLADGIDHEPPADARAHGVDA